MCHESSGSALTETIGIGKGSVSLEDLHQADLIIVAGQNPGTNHPRMLSALETGQERRREDRLGQPAARGRPRAVQEPADRRVGMLDGHRRSPTSSSRSASAATRRSSGLLEHSCSSRPRRRRRPPSSPNTPTATRSSPQAARAADWDETLAATGLDRDEIEQALRHGPRRRERTIVCWAMGLTQHKHSVPTIREVVNLLLLRGNIGRPGAGVCPVRGHSNVQGDRTMGIFERPAAAFLDALDQEFGITSPRAPRLRRRTRHPGHARRRRQGLLRHGRQLRRAPPPTPPSPRPPCAAPGSPSTSPPSSTAPTPSPAPAP